MSLITFVYYFFIIIAIYAFYALIINPIILMLPFAQKGFKFHYIPLLGIAWNLVFDVKLYKDSLRIFKVLASDPKKYRGMITNNVGYASVHLFDPNLIKEFVSKQDNYVRAEFIYGLFCEMIGDGLFFLNGERWKTHRKLISMAFHFELLKLMIPDFAVIAQEIFNQVKTGSMKGVNVMDEFQNITGESVGRLFFGEKFSEYIIDGMNLSKYLAELLTRTGLVTTSASNIIFGKKFVKLGIFKEHRKLMADIKKFMKICLDLIGNKMREMEEAEAKGVKYERRNLIQIFYDQRKSNPTEALTDKEILGEFVTFFLAGMDTTGHAATHAIYYLIKHPEHFSKIKEEVDKYCPSPANANIEDLNKMEFMNNFLKETLRIFNPVPFIFDRIAAVDHQIGDINIKKGTMVNLSLHATLHNANVHNNPDTFDPYRFSNPETLSAQNFASNTFTYTPFSAGPRNCIGQHLALNEAKIIISLFLRNFDFELTNKNQSESKIVRFLYEFEEPLKLDLKIKTT